MIFWTSLQLVLWGILAALSLNFQHYHHPKERPIIEFIMWWVGAFAVYIGASAWVQNRQLCWKLIVVSGLVYRLILVPSNPIQEDDFYRYLWDGAVVANGMNPYLFAPDEIIAAGDVEKREEATLKFKALEESGKSIFNRSAVDLQDDLFRLNILSNQVRIDELHYDKKWNPDEARDKKEIPIAPRVNHGQLPTVYPPLAQGVFALAAIFGEGSLWVLRFIFVLVEGATLLFLVSTLKYLGINLNRVAWYAWNPLVIKEFVNSPHLDVLIVLCCAAFFYFWVSRRFQAAMIWAGIGILAKVTTVVFLPFAFLWRRRVWTGIVFAGLIVAGGHALFESAGERRWQSLKVMSSGFRMNSVSQDLLHFPVSQVLTWLGEDPYESIEAFEAFHLFPAEETGANQILWKMVARKILACLGCVWVIFWLWRSWGMRDPCDQLVRLGTVLLGIFLLSPIANPWYFGILMLFLPLQPRVSFLAIGTLVGLYYSRFYFIYNFNSHESNELFSNVVSWEWLGISLALAFEVWRRKKTTGKFLMENAPVNRH